MGTPIRTEASQMVLLSAGVTDHGTTTPNTIDSVFGYLERGAAGEAEAANAELRQ